MIHANQPVSRHVFYDLVRNGLDWPVGTICFAFGMGVGKWGKLRQDAAHHRGRHRLLNARMAILTRWLAQNPVESLPLTSPDPRDFHGKLAQALGRSLTKKEISLHLGLEASSWYRLLRRPSGICALTRRILGIINHPEPAILAKNWRRWAELAQIEARARGISNLIRAGRWSEPRRRRADA